MTGSGPGRYGHPVPRVPERWQELGSVHRGAAPYAQDYLRRRGPFRCLQQSGFVGCGFNTQQVRYALQLLQQLLATWGRGDCWIDDRQDGQIRTCPDRTG
jgi:hypothetical protein